MYRKKKPKPAALDFTKFTRDIENLTVENNRKKTAGDDADRKPKKNIPRFNSQPYNFPLPGPDRANPVPEHGWPTVRPRFARA